MSSLPQTRLIMHASWLAHDSLFVSARFCRETRARGCTLELDCILVYVILYH